MTWSPEVGWWLVNSVSLRFTPNSVFPPLVKCFSRVCSCVLGFQRLPQVTCFPALATDNILSRACHKYHVFLRLPPVICDCLASWLVNCAISCESCDYRSLVNYHNVHFFLGTLASLYLSYCPAARITSSNRVRDVKELSQKWTNYTKRWLNFQKIINAYFSDMISFNSFVFGLIRRGYQA